MSSTILRASSIGILAGSVVIASAMGHLGNATYLAVLACYLLLLDKS